MPSRVLFFFAFFNYAFSYAFRYNYNTYVETNAIAQSSEACTLPGAAALAVYSIYMVFGLGSFVILVYFSAAIYKVTHLLSVLICPVAIVNCKKRWNKVPTDFSQYEGEFDFDCENDDEQIITEGLEQLVEKNAVVTQLDGKLNDSMPFERAPEILDIEMQTMRFGAAA